jgi:hypothetical protein
MTSSTTSWQKQYSENLLNDVHKTKARLGFQASVESTSFNIMEAKNCLCVFPSTFNYK